MKRIIIIGISLLLSFASFGKEIVTKVAMGGAQIVNGAVLESSDPNYMSPGFGTVWTDYQGWLDAGANAWNDYEFVNHNSEAVIGLVWKDELPVISSQWSFKLILDVQSFDAQGNLIESVQNLEMELDYQPGHGGAFTDAVTKKFRGSHKLSISIMDVIYGAGLTVISSDVELSSTIVTTRYERVTWTDTPPLSGDQSTIDWNDLNSDKRVYGLSWNSIAGAEEYDLEWFFVDASDDPTIPDDDPLFSTLNQVLTEEEWKDATRVTLTKNNYELELPYGKGKLYSRVRSVGRSGRNFDLRYHSDWSVPDILIIEDVNWFYKERNWTYSVGYSEEGLRGESLSFFDGIGRTRQAVTKSNSTGHALVGETVYDFEGRQAIAVTPSPMPGGEFRFYEEYALNGSGELLTAYDFDEDADRAEIWGFSTAGDDGAVLINNNDEVRLTNDYFNSNNAFLNNPTMYPDQTDFAYIPDDGGFPYTKTVFDNQGRVSRQGGMGANHAIGSQHESFVLEGPIQDNTIYKLFGTDAGFRQHYRSSMVRDANGQWSISYSNLSGKVIATGLIGDAPIDSDGDKMVDDLEDSQYSYERLSDNSETSLRHLNEFREVNGMKFWEISKEIPILEKNMAYELNYTFSGDLIFTTPCISGDCQYLLDMEVFAPNGDRVEESDWINIGTSISDYAVSGFSNGPLAILPGNHFSFSIQADNDSEIGHYRVVKRLYLANEGETIIQIGNEVSNMAYVNQVPVTGITRLLDCIDNTSLLVETDTDPCPDAIINEYSSGNPIPLSAQSECEDLLSDMISDMSPGGQYFDNDPLDPSYAVQGGGFAWLELHALDFLTQGLQVTDESGTVVDIDTWDMVLQYWDPIWVGDEGIYDNPDFLFLLSYHPEICHYSYCTSSYPEMSEDFNNNYLFNKTDVTASDPMNPGTLCGAGSNPSHPLLLEPAVIEMGGVNSDFINKVCNFMEDGNGDPVSMWTLANNAVAANSDSDINAWQLFVLMYTREKDKALREHYYTSESINCPYLDLDMDLLSDSGIPDVEEGFSVYFSDETQYVDDIMDEVVAVPPSGTGGGSQLDLPILSELVGDIATQMPCGNSMATTSLYCVNYRQASSSVDPGLSAPLVTFYWGTTEIIILREDEVSDLCSGYECDPNDSESFTLWANCLAAAIREKLESGDLGIGNDPLIYTLDPLDDTGYYNYLTQEDNTYEIWDLSVEVIGNQLRFTFPGTLVHPDGTNARIEIQGANPAEFDYQPCEFDYPNCFCEDLLNSWSILVSGGHPSPTQYLADANGALLDIEAMMLLCIANNPDPELLIEQLEALPSWNPDFACWEVEDDCMELAEADAEFATFQNLQEATENLTESLVSGYIDGCMGNTEGYGPDDLILKSDYKMYHFTLYYYDRVGNLVKTVPPNGVRMIDENIFGTNPGGEGYEVDLDAAIPDVTTPDHKMETEYEYNTIGQIYRSETPDGGETEMYYDDLGRVRYSRNAQQKIDNQYSYTKYDEQGRLFESGRVDVLSTDPAFFDNVVLQDEHINNTIDYPWNSTAAKTKEKTSTYYDNYDGPMQSTINDLFVDGTGNVIGQQNTRGRVVATSYAHDGSKYQPDALTAYTYDVSGNATEYWKYDSDLYMYEQIKDEAWKHFEYEFDLFSGKVEEMHYQKGMKDAISHRYSYDADLRLTIAESSTDGFIWDRDAEYFYYPHGPLKRMELGDRKIQGLDYIYNINGWIKGVNASSGKHADDPGGDGEPSGMGTDHSTFASDVMGYSLHYHDADYEAIGSSGTNPLIGNLPYMGFLQEEEASLYNGNISNMCYSLTKPSIGVMQEQSGVHWSKYRYDQLHRIKSMRTRTMDMATASTINEWSPTVGSPMEYATDYSYDANGNIMSLKRYNGSAVKIDDLSYYYHGKTIQNANRVTSLAANVNHMNRLMFVRDGVLDITATGDLDDQMPGISNGPNIGLGTLGGLDGMNYGYDAIGNLVRDYSEGIDDIFWTISGKVSEVKKEDGTMIGYTYDESGNRKGKSLFLPVGTDGIRHVTYSHYMRDASGNVMALYERKVKIDGSTSDLVTGSHELKLKERHIYGSSRHGLLHSNLDMLTGLSETNARTKGARLYELSNHLGNVLNTFTDVKVRVDNGNGVFSHYIADVSSMTDYYPFGWEISERKVVSPNGYRFGFNGKEDDGDWGMQNIQDYGFRLYNPSIAKFLSTDPLASKYPFYTPYQFASNTPIVAIDVDGLESHIILNDVERIERDVPEVEPDRLKAYKKRFYRERGFALTLIQHGQREEGLRYRSASLRELAEEARHYGWSQAAENLERFLDGTQGTLTISSNHFSKYKTTQIALEFNNERFLTHKGGGVYKNVGDFANTLSNLSNGKNRKYFNDYYSTVVHNNGLGRFVTGSNKSSEEKGFQTELAFSSGDYTLTSTAHLSVRKDGNKFYLSGHISHVATDIYNWDTDYGLNVTMFGITITDGELSELREVGAKSFNIQSTEWKTNVAEGSYFIKKSDGSFDFSNVKFNY